MRRDDPEVAAINRSAEQLRARAAARLADPNTPPWKRKLLEARQPPAWELEDPMPKPTRTRQRKPSLASVIVQMKHAGLDIAGCEIAREGTVKVVTGKPVDASDSDSDDTRSPDRRWN